MHNTIFSNKGTEVFLLQSQDVSSLIQAGLGQALGHRTKILFCGKNSKDTKTRSFKVDMQQLSQAFSSLSVAIEK